MTTAVDDREEAALLGLEPVAPDRTYWYGRHPSQVIDLYRESAGEPVVALLHGGFWRDRFDRGHLSPLAAALAAGTGRCVALVEYRRVGEGGGWPETFDDMAPALAALPGSRPVTLVGHSAGGQLALWAAARLPAAVDRTVVVSPVADLAHAHELGIGDGAVAELLGGREHVAGRLDETCPLRQRAPVSPVVVLHGTEDVTVPVELSRRYARVRPAHLRELPEAGHYAPVTPGTAAYAALRAAVIPGARPVDPYGR